MQNPHVSILARLPLPDFFQPKEINSMQYQLLNECVTQRECSLLFLLICFAVINGIEDNAGFSQKTD